MPRYRLYFHLPSPLPPSFINPSISFPLHRTFQYLILNLTFWACLSLCPSIPFTILFTTHFLLPLHQSKCFCLCLSHLLPSKHYHPLAFHAMLFAAEVLLHNHPPTHMVFFSFLCTLYSPTLARLLSLMKILYYSRAPQYTSLILSTLFVRPWKQGKAVRVIYTSRSCLHSSTAQLLYLVQSRQNPSLLVTLTF
jgi:hypothetical protein